MIITKLCPYYCFVNNYFDVGLKAWQNLDIEPAFNEYKVVTDMFQLFWKTEGQCSQAMKQSAKDTFENNMHYYATMKTIPKAYLGNRECSVQVTIFLQNWR